MTATVADACPVCTCPTVAHDVRERRPWRYLAYACPACGAVWTVAEAVRLGRRT